MLKILQPRLQQYMNWEIPDLQVGFRKGRGTRGQIPNIRWITEKAREFQKKSTSASLSALKLFDCVDHNKLWKILKEMGIPDHLTCLLRNLYVGQEATEPNMEQLTSSKLWKEGQSCILSPCLFNLYVEHIMQNAGLNHKLDSRLLGEISTTSDGKWYHSNGKKWRGAKEPLDEGERGEWKSWLKTQHSKNEDHGIWSHRFTANRWGNNQNSDSVFLGSKSHCRRWVQPRN